MNRVKNFIGAMREKGVRTVKRAVPAFFTAYCYFSMYVPVYAAKATGTSVITSGFNSLYEIVAAKLGKEKTPVVIHGGSGLSAETFTRLIELGGRKVNISTLVKNAYLDKTKELILSGEKFAPIPFDTEVENAVKEEVKKHLEVFSGKRTSF